MASPVLIAVIVAGTAFAYYTIPFLIVVVTTLVYVGRLLEDLVWLRRLQECVKAERIERLFYFISNTQLKLTSTKKVHLPYPDSSGRNPPRIGTAHPRHVHRHLGREEER